MRTIVHVGIGGLSGIYFGFSTLQVAQFVTVLANVVINPLPFVIIGFTCAVIFCAKRFYDQYRLDLKKTISVLECELALNEKARYSLQQQLHPNNGTNLAGMREECLLQSLSEQEAAYEQKYQQLNAAKMRLNSSLQWGNNFLNVSQKTVSRVKNITLGVMNLASLASFTGMATIKILAGASLVSVLGGPVGIIIMATVVTAAVLYTWYNMRQRHQQQTQKPAFQLPKPQSPQLFKEPQPEAPPLPVTAYLSTSHSR